MKKINTFLELTLGFIKAYYYFMRQTPLSKDHAWVINCTSFHGKFPFTDRDNYLKEIEKVHTENNVDFNIK